MTIRNVNQVIDLEKSIANDKMKTILLRSVSHELRTPLSAIEFFTNDMILHPKSQRTDEENENLKIVSISSKLMLSLINDLLDYSKILAGVFSTTKTFCDIRAIVYNSCELIHMQAYKKNITLITRIDPKIPEIIWTDPLRLSQVLLNILNNALKFTLKGSIEVCC